VIVVFGAPYEVGLADFVIVMPGLSTAVPGSVAEDGLPSFDETVTELVNAPGAVEALVLMVAGKVTFGSAVPAATGGAYVQVTVWPAVVQDHPVPLAVPGVTPAGSVAVRVIGSFSFPPVAVRPELRV
jgi:hypothetical protein